MTQPVDILIIGSGASGAAAAWRLSSGNAGLKILCLEQGSMQDPLGYPSASADWELEKEARASSDPNIRNNFADYPIDCSQSPIAVANFNGFGGSTVLYSGHFPRFHPSDFSTYSQDGVAVDWPFNYRDLEPYFQLNEKMMGIAGLVGDPANPEYESLLPPVPLGPAGRRLADGFNQLGWHWWPSYAAISTKRAGNRSSCINLGPCNTGCSQGAKGSVDVTYWPQARQQGVEVRTNCQVIRIESGTAIGNRDFATGVHYIDDKGNQHFQSAKVIVVAASGVGTPRLLLNSRSNRFQRGLLNDYDVVGRHLMLHPLAYTEAIFEEDLRSSLGPQGCCFLSQEFYETVADRGFVRGYTMQVLRGSAPIETAVKYFLLRQLPFGENHHQNFRSLFNHNIGISVIVEDLPEWENRITLNFEKRDKHGMPGVVCKYTLSENSKKMLKHGLARSRDVLTAAGAKVSTAFGPVRNAGWHLMGTARMGEDPTTSVVSQFGQAHELKNLFIVDSSIFVTAGAVNPVATAQAITLRCCDYLLVQLNELLRRRKED